MSLRALADCIDAFNDCDVHSALRGECSECSELAELAEFSDVDVDRFRRLDGDALSAKLDDASIEMLSALLERRRTMDTNGSDVYCCQTVKHACC